MKTCPACAEEVQDDAHICRFCGYDFKRRRSPNSGGDTLSGCFKGGCLAPIGLAIILAVIGGLVGHSPANKTSITPVQPGQVDQAAVTKLVDEMSWTYEHHADPMTGKSVAFATTTSKNSANFHAPYDGGSVLYLTVRQHPRFGTSVSFTIDKGQMLCDVSDGCSIIVRLDDGKPRRFHAGEPSDFDPKTVFLTSPRGFITALKTAKTAVIEVEFYQDGIHAFTFNVRGLKWPPPKG